MEHLVFLNLEYLFYQVYKFVVGDPAQKEDLAAQVTLPDVNLPDINLPEVPTFDESDVQEVTGLTPDLITLWDLFTFIIILVSLILLVGIVYAIIRMSQVRTKERARFREMEHEHQVPKENAQWQMIKDHSESNDPQSWKVALEEADLLLSDEARKKRIPQGQLEKYRDWQSYTSEHADEILTKAKTKEALEGYEAALKKLRVL